MWYVRSFFFFQAEDGIRDYKVTGVQTCALPISRQGRRAPAPGRRDTAARCPAWPSGPRVGTRAGSWAAESYAMERGSATRDQAGGPLDDQLPRTHASPLGNRTGRYAGLTHAPLD